MKKYLILFIIITMLFFGCTSQNPENDSKDKILIATTSYPIYDFVRNVVNEDEFEIWLMLPSGLNAHSYEPTPQDLVKLQETDVVVYTTKYFEIWADDTIKTIDNKNTLIIEAGKNVQLVKPDDETLGPVDPHIWLSPKNAETMVETISNEIKMKYPEKAEGIEKKTTEYLKELNELDKKYLETTKKCKKKEMFVSHAAFGYLVKHYDLIQIPIIKNFDPQGEVSLADLAGVIEAAKQHNATHVFFEDFISPKLSEEVAKEINGKTAIFSPMEAYATKQIEEDSYIKIMERNLEVLSEALECV